MDISQLHHLKNWKRKPKTQTMYADLSLEHKVLKDNVEKSFNGKWAQEMPKAAVKIKGSVHGKLVDTWVLHLHPK